jgi:hypothetical protein
LVLLRTASVIKMILLPFRYALRLSFIFLGVDRPGPQRSRL